MNETLCYLCGESGADSRDHVPPKAFLDHGHYNKASRITLPAHSACNRMSSADEEYVRDLVGPASQVLGLPGVQRVLDKIERAWQRPEGLRRKRKLLKSSVPVSLQSAGGIYLRRAIGIKFDRDKVNLVGNKIARGIIYHDTHAVISGETVGCVGIPLNNALEERPADV